MASALPGVFSGQAFDFGYHSSFKTGLFAGTGLFNTGICETAAGTVNHLVLNDVAHTGQKKKQRKRRKRIKKKYHSGIPPERTVLQKISGVPAGIA